MTSEVSTAAIVMPPALVSVLASTYARVFVRMTLKASAPAPLRERPPRNEPVPAALAAKAVAVIVASSVARTAMSLSATSFQSVPP